MDLLELMKHRRSIRRYQDKQISRADLETIMEAGTYAPNAGGGQRSMIVGIRDAALTEKIGKMNVARFDRSRLIGGSVSSEQPSIIDNPAMKSGFYGAPSVCIVFAQKNFLYSIPDAFCCAENMVLMAAELGVSSCIVARGEETFDNEVGAALLHEWGVPDNYIACCFVLLGYVDGDYPSEKPRKVGRWKIVEHGGYQNLLELVKGKDYFVLTTNVDHCFQKADFDKKRLFYTQGDYGLFQCREPCCQETFDNEGVIKTMMEQQGDMRIPSSLIPHCPYCGKPLTMNLRADDRFVEDEGWHSAAERYSDFLHHHENTAVLFLELGVGYNTPVIIKYSFWKMTAANGKATYTCINFGKAVCPQEISKQSICFDSDIGQVLQDLSK